MVMAHQNLFFDTTSNCWRFNIWISLVASAHIASDKHDEHSDSKRKIFMNPDNLPG